jgi:hypothetical protein
MRAHTAKIGPEVPRAEGGVADAYCQWYFLHDCFNYSEHDDGRPRTSTFAESGATCGVHRGSETARGVIVWLGRSTEWTPGSPISNGLPTGNNTGLPLSESTRDADDFVTVPEEKVWRPRRFQN